MASKAEMWAEAYRRGIVPDDKIQMVEEGMRRGLIPNTTRSPDTIEREAARSAADKGNDFLIGVGRGVTDLGQAGRQLFESSPLGGLTDVSAEDYQDRVRREQELYDEGLGDSFTAGAGRFVGQTVPSAMAGGAAGGVARALGNTATRSASGGAIVSGAAGGASTQAGEDTDDILMAGGIGGATGAATGVLSNRLGAASRNRPISDINISEQTDNILTRPVDKIVRDAMRSLSNRFSSGSKPQSFKASSTFGADAPPFAVSRVGSRFRDEMADLGEKATMSFPELIKSTNLYDLGTGAIGYTAGGPLGAAGAIAGRRGATALGRLGAAGVRDTVERAPNLSSAVMGNVGGDMGEEAHQRVLSSIIEDYSTENEAPDDEKAAMHELSQTNPAFRIALDRALKDE